MAEGENIEEGKFFILKESTVGTSKDYFLQQYF